MRFLSKLSLLAVCWSFVALNNGYGQGLASNKLGSKNSLFLELGGAAGIASLNYDRLLLAVGGKIKLSGRLGISSYSDFYENTSPDLFIPFGGFAMYAFGLHHVELGLGFTFLNYAARNIDEDGKVGFIRIKELLFNPSLGYRLQSSEGGLFLRASYTPFVYGKPVIFSSWGGISIGFTLKERTAASKPLIINQ